ncbi:MAG: CDP-diacylglycerol--glycerol-3-phosphate 3-phosphatidyltransferase [Actinomycetota bacterium]
MARDPARLTRLTSLRIVLVPVVMVLILAGPRSRPAFNAAAITFAVASVTDFLDGYLARRWSLTTNLGSFLDTTADKLLVSGTLIALVAVERASPWVAVIIVGREFVIMGLRGVVATDGSVMTPSIWGKAKFNVQALAILLALLRPPLRVGPLLLDEWVMLVAAVVTVLSAVEYLVRFASVLSSSPRHRS